MAEAHHQVDVVPAEKPGFRSGPTFIIGGLTGGHGVFHWFAQSFIVMLPEVREFYMLSAVQVGAITTTREFISGLIALPGALITDMLYRYWGLILTVCMAIFGLGWLVIGYSPIYPVLLLGMALTAMSSSVWHLPAIAALSHHFSNRRGSVLSFHGVGGNIGDVAAPAVTGLLLGIFAWQGIIKVYAVIPLFLAFVVLWAYRDIGRISREASPTSGETGQISFTKRSFLLWLLSYVAFPVVGWVLIMLRLKSLSLWGVTLVAGLRGMAFVSFITFLPLYLNDELGLSVQARGLYIALLLLVGIGFTPIMGYLSDRLGRKLVLVPGMLLLSILSLLLVPFGQGIPLIVILGLLGMFLYSDQPILTAAALDLVGGRAAATTLGVLSFPRFIMGAASPLIGGTLYARNFDFNFYYVAALFGLAALILLFLPLHTTEHAQPEAG